jgi:hypothetical protein
MKRIVISTAIVGIGIFFFVGPNRADSVNAQATHADLWEVGRCYRVYPHDRDQFYGFRVLEPPRGQWVRAQPDPPPLQRPGMPPPAPFWLNTSSLFGVQEWTCAEQR